MKKSLLLIGLLALGATSYAVAGDFYFTNEVKVNVEENFSATGRQKNEWTVAKGYYAITDTVRFNFDADRDYMTYNNGNPNNQGWDTEWSLQKDLGTVNFLGRDFTTRAYLDYFWDRAYAYTTKDGDRVQGKVEERTGLRFNATTKLDNGATVGTTLYGRYISRTDKEINNSNDVYALALNYSQTLSPNWRVSLSATGTYGGFDSEAGSTFGYDIDEDGEITGGRDGFNYWLVANFQNDIPVYKNDKAYLGIKTNFLSEFYAQGEDFDGTSSQYDRNTIRTGLTGNYKIAEDFSIHAEARYNVYGYRKNSNGTSSDFNEFEAIAGFKFNL